MQEPCKLVTLEPHFQFILREQGFYQKPPREGSVLGLGQPLLWMKAETLATRAEGELVRARPGHPDGRGPASTGVLLLKGGGCFALSHFLSLRSKSE